MSALQTRPFLSKRQPMSKRLLTLAMRSLAPSETLNRPGKTRSTLRIRLQPGAVKACVATLSWQPLHKMKYSQIRDGHGRASRCLKTSGSSLKHSLPVCV